MHPQTSRSRRASARVVAVPASRRADGSAATAVEPLEARRLLAAAVVDFEALAGPVAGSGGVYVDAAGYRFVNQTSNGNTDASGPRLYGKGDGFASKVIQPANWGERILVDRPDGGNFDLASFDFATNVFGGRGDFEVVGRFANGTTQTIPNTVFRTKALETRRVNWAGLQQVTVNFNGGENAAYGTLDNFRFGTVGGPAVTVTGSLVNPNPVAGPLGVVGQRLENVVPLPNGRFYTLGLDDASGLAYAVRHLPDGQIDRSYFDNGRRDLRDTRLNFAYFFSPFDYTVVPRNTGGFYVLRGNTLSRIDADLSTDTTFGGSTGGNNGSVFINGKSAFNKIAVDAADNFYVYDQNTVRVAAYDSNGRLLSDRPVGLSGIRDANNVDASFYNFDVAPDGSLFFALSTPSESFVVKFVAGNGSALTRDLSYGGGDGIASSTAARVWVEPSGFDAGPGGRVAFVSPNFILAGSSDRLSIIDAAGNFTAVNAPYFSNDNDETVVPQAFFFHADGDVSSAFAFRDLSVFRGNPQTAGFGARRYNADGTPDAQFPAVLRRGENVQQQTVVGFPDGDFLVNNGGQIYKIDTGPGNAVTPPAPSTGFGTDGKAVLRFDGFDYVRVDESVPAPDGGVFVIGRRGNTNLSPTDRIYPGSQTPAADTSPFVAKLKVDGGLDASFGLLGSGVTTPARLGWPDGMSITGLKPAPGGGYLGTFGSNEGHARVGDRLVKLDAGFRLDSGFGGGDGIAEATGFGPFDQRPDGKIVFAGLPFAGDGYVELYNADGSLVGGSRRTIPALLGRDLFITDVATGLDNSVYFTTDSYPTPDRNGRTFSLAKLTPSLNLSPGFADNGVKTVEFSSTDIYIGNDVYVGPQGQTVWTFTEDDARTTIIPSDAAGRTLPGVDRNGFRIGVGTPAVPDSSFYVSPQILDVGFTADGGFTAAALYGTSTSLAFYGVGQFSGPNAFSLAKFRADGTPDTAFGTDGVRSVFSRQPILINDAVYVGDGRFFVAGADDASNVVGGGDGVYLDRFKLNGSVRLIDVDGGGATTPPPTGGTSTTVNFEGLSGNTAGGGGVYTAPGGYRFTDRGSIGNLSTGGPLLLGTAQGFASKVIQPANFGERIVVDRADAKTFDLASFDYAANLYGGGGDFTVTGTRPNGLAPLTRTVAFGGSKSPATLSLNWTGLTGVSVDFNGGANSAYGTLDNFKLATGGGTVTPPTPVATGFAVEAEAFTSSRPGQSNAWTTVAGGVGSAVQAAPDLGVQYNVFADYSTKSPRLDYAVTVPAAGRYYLWARGRGVTGNVGGSDTVHFGLNGGRVETLEAVNFAGDRFEWSNARYKAGRAYIDLAAGGTFTMSMWMREDGVAVDRFLLTRDADYTPTGNGPAAGVLA